MKRALIYCLSGSLFFVACHHNKKENSPPGFDLTVVKGWIDSANKVYGERFLQNDTAYYLAKYCKDAVIMPEQVNAIAGRDSIRYFYYNNGQNKDLKISITATSMYGSSDAIVEEGFYTFPGDDGKIYDKGKFIAIWKQEEGKWKLYREIWNSDKPPALK